MATILVTGATGKQGGALIKNLIEKKARKLVKESKNITLVQGDLDNPSEIFKNAQAQTSEPIWGVFSVQV
jgi:uncharacterized protein YbjT (DUF2867 family)